MRRTVGQQVKFRSARAQRRRQVVEKEGEPLPPGSCAEPRDREPARGGGMTVGLAGSGGEAGRMRTGHSRVLFRAVGA